MFRKMLFGFCVLVLLLAAGGAQPVIAGDSSKNSISDSTQVAAREKLPTWKLVFDGSFMEEETWWFLYVVEPFNEQFYAIFSRGDGAQVYRSANGIDWEAVTEPGMGYDSDYVYCWDATVFKGQLYVGLNDYGVTGKPGLIMRTKDGVDWEPAFEADTATLEGNLIDKLGVYEGMIYATTVWENGQIWRSATGDPGSWEKVTASLGTDIDSTRTFVAFQDYLYLSGLEVGGDTPGVRLWRSIDGITWDTVGEGVLDEPGNEWDGGLVAFHDKLYFSVTHFPDGGRMYRSIDGINWEVVVEGGFDDPVNASITDLIVFQGDIYATTNNCCTGDFIPHVWRSHTGNSMDWVNVSGDVFGDAQGFAWSEKGSLTTFKENLYFVDVFWGNIYVMEKP